MWHRPGFDADGSPIDVTTTWRHLVESTTFAATGPATLELLGVEQGDVWGIDSDDAGLYTAVDGLTLNTMVWDFETVNPTKDDCKDDGWATSWPAGTWKNQGECISHFARLD